MPRLGGIRTLVGQPLRIHTRQAVHDFGAGLAAILNNAVLAGTVKEMQHLPLTELAGV